MYNFESVKSLSNSFYGAIEGNFYMFVVCCWAVAIKANFIVYLFVCVCLRVAIIIYLSYKCACIELSPYPWIVKGLKQTWNDKYFALNICFCVCFFEKEKLKRWICVRQNNGKLFVKYTANVLSITETSRNWEHYDKVICHSIIRF